ncbi:MAG: hypothetical protein K8R63_12685 [Bacteroidales bacterium]|nr:hypothetical protein [Bacteroidales bacterium]
MTREEKIKMIQDIKNGTPPHFALNRSKYRYLTRNESENHFWSMDGQKISREEQEKYFPDSFLCVNVSKQYQIDENGQIVKRKLQVIPTG